MEKSYRGHSDLFVNDLFFSRLLLKNKYNWARIELETILQGILYTN